MQGTRTMGAEQPIFLVCSAETFKGKCTSCIQLLVVVYLIKEEILKQSVVCKIKRPSSSSPSSKSDRCNPFLSNLVPSQILKISEQSLQFILLWRRKKEVACRHKETRYFIYLGDIYQICIRHNTQTLFAN